MIVTAGKTNVSVYYYIVGDAGNATPGEPVTGLLFSDIETGGSASYARQGAARVDLTLITLASASATHADGGFILVDDTNMPGVYRCDYPDAAFLTGVDEVSLAIVVASAKNAVAAPIKAQITDVDLRDAVRGGMTALPNAAADAAGGLPISDAGGLNLDTQLAATNEVTAARMAALTDWIDGNRLDALLDAIPTTAMRGTDSAALASVATEGRLAELDAANLPTDIAAIPTTAMRGTDGALTDKAGFSLSATGLDAIVSTALGMVEIAKAIWDRVLTGATHNITNSAGKKLRQLEAAFVVAAGTAQAGSANTITLAAGETSVNDIFRGDRIIIVGGTGQSEHDIVTAYNGTTKVCTVAETWVTTPDATSEYELQPASVDIETWQHNVVTGLGDLAQIEADTAATAAAATEARLAELDAANLPTDIAAIPTVMRGTDSAALASEVTAARMSELDAGTGGKMANVVDAIKVETTSLDGTKIPDTLSLANINAEVDTALDTAIPELSQGIPIATPTIRTGLMLLYMTLRNKLVVQTSGTDALEIYNDAGTLIVRKLLTDNGSDYTETKASSGA